MPKEKSLAEEMLEDLAEITGIPVAELRQEYETFPVYDEPTADEPLDLDVPEMDTDAYFDYLFDEIDVDADAEMDQYAED